VQTMTSRHQRVVGILLVLGIVLVGIAAIALPTAAATPPVGGLGLAIEEYEDGFFQVTDITNAGDERLFVVQQDGTVEIVDGGGNTLPTPFLDISSVVCLNYQSGLLGLVFHPDYDENGYFFVNYNTPTDGTDCANGLNTIIARYKVSADPNVADPASELVVLDIEQPIDDNNGGDLVFGPLDGYLYIPLGDGGGPRQPTMPSQDGNSLLGKILRIDVSTSDTGPAYTIPADNPFVGDPNVRDEIWAMGLRNPWRVAFDSLTGDLYIADVGEFRQEEINFQSADSEGGENYGWPCYEGTYMYTDTTCSGVLTEPIFTGPHGMGNPWIAITGGFVYRGSDYPLLDGYYVFSDVGTGRIVTLKRDTNGDWQTTDEGQLVQAGVVTFGESANGEIYLSDYTFDNDRVYHLVDTRVQPTVTPTATATPEERLLYLPLIRYDQAP
jgi:glucose/arabinose dehydrogenase